MNESKVTMNPKALVIARKIVAEMNYLTEHLTDRVKVIMVREDIEMFLDGLDLKICPICKEVFEKRAIYEIRPDYEMCRDCMKKREPRSYVEKFDDGESLI